MAKLDLLRKLIREEVRTVFQEELAGILKEALMSNRTQPVITETVKPRQTVPGTLNTRAGSKLAAPILKGNNPLNSILQETAAAMTPEDYKGLSDSPGYDTDVPIVESVNEMYATARKSSNLEAIQITTVPDFTGIMEKMSANGEI